MIVYKIKKNGKRVTKKLLDDCEACSMSEEEIARYLGITRRGLYKIRDKMNWPHKSRSDKGKPRKNV